MINDFCSIGSTWSQKSWFKWAVLGAIGLLLLTLLIRCNPIESDLSEKTQSQLNDSGMSWASTSLDGRDVIVTGEAPSREARDRAIALMEGVDGVRTVDHEITLKQWVSSQFNLEQRGEMMVLTGMMPDQTSINAIAGQAHSLYGDTRVSNKLEMNDSASAPAWLAGTTELMASLYSARNLAMSVSDDKVKITGEVETEAEKATLIAKAYASYGELFSETIKVVKTRPTAEELAVIAAEKLAEEARLAEADHLAEAARLATELEARLAESTRLAAEAAAAHLTKVTRLAAELDARLAEATRLATEAEAARLAEVTRLAAEAEATRLAKESRLAAEAEAARLAEESRLAAEAEAARLAEVANLEAEVKAALLEALADCQAEFKKVLGTNTAIFNQNSSRIRGESYHALGLLAQKINYCSDALHIQEQHIYVSAHAGEGEASPISPLMKQQRMQAVIAYLEIISGAHHGLLRQNNGQAVENHSHQSQLHFNISE